MLDRWLTPEQARIERSAVYTFHSVLAKGWRQGRLLIAGDAAHQTPPFMGQGMCAGVRDAANLAWKLDDIISGAADDTLLDTYEAERAPHARIFIEEAVRLGHVIRDTDETISRGKQAPQEKFVTPQPRLGGGAHLGCGHAGAVSEQPLLASGQRLDQLAGYDSILLAAPALAEAARVFDRTLKIATADSPASRDYLDRLGVRAVLIRRDRISTAPPAASMSWRTCWRGSTASCGPSTPPRTGHGTAPATICDQSFFLLLFVHKKKGLLALS